MIVSGSSSELRQRIVRTRSIHSPHMPLPRILVAALAALLSLTTVPVVAASAAGQSSAAAAPQSTAAPRPAPGSTADKPAAQAPAAKDQPNDIEALKVENIALRELLRQMEEQLKTVNGVLLGLERYWSSLIKYDPTFA